MSKRKHHRTLEEAMESVAALESAEEEVPAMPIAPVEAPAAVQDIQSENDSKILAAKWLRGDSSAVAKAFLMTEKMTHRNRKLTDAQWEAVWSEFVNQAR